MNEKQGNDYILFFKYILLIMLLQLSHFFTPSFPSTLYPSPSSIPPPQFMSMDHTCKLFGFSISILFLTTPSLFCTYNLCFLLPVPFPPFFPTPLRSHVISISVILFLFWLFAQFGFVFQVQLLIVVSLLSFHCLYFLSSSFSQISLFNFLYSKGLVMMNSFNLTLSGVGNHPAWFQRL